MSLDPLFLEAFTHRPGGHVILGRKLHALCALDLLALEAVCSPFLFDGAKCEVADLILAVWLLSNPPADDLQVHHLELDDAGREWLKSLAGQIDLERDCKAVSDYMADFYSPPEMMRNVATNALTAMGAPWMLGIVVTVCGKLGVSLRDAWLMPIGNLLWYRCSIEEQETESRIISPDLRAELDRAKNNGKIMQMEPGELLADFAKRTGIPEATAAILLHNQSRK